MYIKFLASRERDVGAPHSGVWASKDERVIAINLRIYLFEGVYIRKEIYICT